MNIDQDLLGQVSLSKRHTMHITTSRSLCSQVFKFALKKTGWIQITLPLKSSVGSTLLLILRVDWNLPGLERLGSGESEECELDLTECRDIWAGEECTMCLGKMEGRRGRFQEKARGGVWI